MGLAAILLPAVEAARYTQNLPYTVPLLVPFHQNYPLLFVLITPTVSVTLTIGLLATIRSLSPSLARRIVWIIPKQDRVISPKTEARISAVIAVVLVGSFLLCCSGILFYSQPEEISQLPLSDSCTAIIFAEGSFHYEPPGYLSIEVLDNGNVVVPRYKFVGIGPERVPEPPFTAITSDDGTVAALIQNKDVQFMIDFESGEYWPPSDWNVAQFAPDLADRLFLSLASHHELTFSRLESMKRYAEFKKSRNKRLDPNSKSDGS